MKDNLDMRLQCVYRERVIKFLLDKIQGFQLIELMMRLNVKRKPWNSLKFQNHLELLVGVEECLLPLILEIVYLRIIVLKKEVRFYFYLLEMLEGRK